MHLRFGIEMPHIFQIVSADSALARAAASLPFRFRSLHIGSKLLAFARRLLHLHFWHRWASAFQRWKSPVLLIWSFHWSDRGLS